MGLTFLPPHPTTASLPTYRLITTTSSSPFIFPLFLVGIAAADVAAGSYHTCALLDAGHAATKQTSMVKYFASEMAERVTSEALQILGGAGYTTLHPIERYWRDARLTKIFEGTSEIQQRIISDQMLGKPTRN